MIKVFRILPHIKKWRNPAIAYNLLIYAKNDTNKIGYINKDYIESNGNDYCLSQQYQTKTLRLQDNIADPNKHHTINGFPHKGHQITPMDKLSFACGEQTKNGLENRLYRIKAKNGLIFYFYNRKRISKEKAIKIKNK